MALASGEITLEQFRDVLLRYQDHVPDNLRDLDEYRYETLPKILKDLKARKKPYSIVLGSDEISKLVHWKLKHGTFRPSLLKQVTSNPEGTVKSTTTRAFAEYHEDCNLRGSVISLSTLKGIGPATASLILSCYDPDRVPFYSDELFRWMHYEEGKGYGWDRKIKYTLKEYSDLHSAFETFQRRLKEQSGVGISALEAEKVAYVLGKERVDLSPDRGTAVLSSGQEVETTREGEAEGTQQITIANVDKQSKFKTRKRAARKDVEEAHKDEVKKRKRD